MMSSSLAFFFAALISSSAASAPIADVFVDINAANCASGTGTLTDPVCSIGAAIALAAPGDTIRIAPGTYLESIALDKDLELIGTGGALVTVVDGSGPGAVITVGATISATINGLDVKSVSVTPGGDFTLRNSTVGAGGVSAGSSAGLGTTVCIDTCEMLGAGVSVRNTNLTIANTTIASPVAYYPYYSGVYARDSDLTIADSTVSNNYGYKGGGISMFRGTLIMTGSTVSNNNAHMGGGLYFYYADFEIRNSTISNNNASSVGGLRAVGGPATKSLTNVTVTGNVGGGLFVEQQSPIKLSHSIVAGNLSGGSGPDIRGKVHVTDHNLIGEAVGNYNNGITGNISGSAANPLDPGLGPLQDNGGPTKTHALLFGSPAIDAGDVATSTLLDQRGFTRTSGSAPDIGAYEFDIAEVSLCSGDGGDQLGCTNCPCGNNAALGTVGGCLNSAGTSAVLSASGSPSASVPPMSTNDLRLSLSGLPALKFSLLTSGAAVAPTNGGNPCFGLSSGLQSIDRDGLRCAVMSLKRHGGRSADMLGEIMDSTGPSRVWGGEAQPHGGLWKQGGFASGQTRYFQAIYREHPTLGCARGLNTSQAVEVTFFP